MADSRRYGLAVRLTAYDSSRTLARRGSSPVRAGGAGVANAAGSRIGSRRGLASEFGLPARYAIGAGHARACGDVPDLLRQEVTARVRALRSSRMSRPYSTRHRGAERGERDEHEGASC